MGIIGLIVFVIIACVFALFDASEGGGGSCSFPSRSEDNDCEGFAYHARGRSRKESFDASDSFFDEDGNEHEVDDDGYCEECDDYHEE